jgi:signal transduction histidine kinase
VVPADHMIPGRAFASQQPVLSVNAMRDDPEHAARYRASNATTILAAPITAAEQRLGVLAIFGERAPIFAEDDLELVALLGAQAAVILESHFLIDEAADVRAREEAARLKDDFLSAAAHDLKTPLTAVVAQAQLLERRARRNPEAPIDVQGVERIVKEAQRLKGLVEELLDVTRAEQGKLVHRREPVDLVPLVREACERHSSTWHTFTPVVEESLTGEYDRQRILQLLDNLLENAVKYSPDGGEVRVALWRENDTAHLTVTDNGIGIPAADLPRLFDRFHRGGNVDDRRFAGLGLGLFICHGIVEQHGGSISATSPGPGRGSTFHVVLPCHAPAVETAPAVVRPISSATSSIPAVGEQAL